ncbi:MAG TPA: 50S ribosomal protein L23 [Actinobacteria bacterium]|nr:50S ribosomal protein L23 [Actinomycetota bacterium]
MKDLRDVIIRPLISEKSYESIEQSKYTFEVHPGAKKTEIRQAVEEIFNVAVTDVNTISVKGKPKKRGYATGRTKNWKKAIVTLKEGQRIEFFETK